LLTPFAESHSSFRNENTLDRPLACAAIYTECFQCPLFARIGKQHLRNSQGSGIGWVGQLQGDGTGCFQLIDDDFDDNPLVPPLLEMEKTFIR